MPEGKRKQCYPTKDQYTCIICKERKFYSWADFENHHSQHAVQYAMTKLPVVKLVRFDSLLQGQTKKVSDKCVTSGKPEPVKEDAAPRNTLTVPLNNGLYSPDITWPGSCEEDSPAQPAPSSIETAPEQTDNILDPDFIEQLGIEISFLNQASGEAQPIAVQDTKVGVVTVPNETFVDISSPNHETCSISPADSTVVSINKEMAQISEEIEIISEKSPPLLESSSSGKPSS